MFQKEYNFRICVNLFNHQTLSNKIENLLSFFNCLKLDCESWLEFPLLVWATEKTDSDKQL